MDGFALFAAPCHYETDIGAALRRAQTETVVASGITLDGSIFTLYANPQTGTFTAVVKAPDKMSCIIEAGTDFETQKAGDDL